MRHRPRRAVRTYGRERPGSGAGPEPPDDREAALAAGARWVRNPALDALVAGEPAAPVLGFADGNLANYLWDGSRIRLVDFESSGRADRIQELAEIAEHVSVWVDSSLDADALLGHFPLTRPERARLRDLRRLAALMWLLMLDGDSRTPARATHRAPWPGRQSGCSGCWADRCPAGPRHTG